MNVKLALKEQFRATAKVRSHEIVMDEPLEVGGEDTAATPTELLGAALAGCTAITLKMYLQHKGYAVEDILVEVSTEKGEKNKITKFIRHIKAIGLSQDAPKERLLKVAQACPVHKLLETGTPIETFWQD